MKITQKRYEEMLRQDQGLLLMEQRGEITEEEYSTESDEILDKILGFENVYQFNSFRDFEVSFSRSIEEAYRSQGIPLPSRWRDFIIGEARHEREHVDVSLRYGLNPTYCFMHDATNPPGSWQPFNFVRSMDIFRKGWDQFTRLKYHAETLSAPAYTSRLDKESLRVTIEKVLSERSLSPDQRAEVLGIIYSGLAK